MDKQKINPYALEQINNIKEKCAEIHPLVVINCMTYNHGDYLKDTLNGFIMQKTKFPFVAIVHDDASIDATAHIIKEFAQKYPKIILPIFEHENQYSKKDAGVVPIMNLACKESGAKYIAMCEGDDYWTDPLKLQKQVDFLESNPDYGLVYTQVLFYSQEAKSIIKKWGGPYESFRDLIQYNTIPTLSVMYRFNLYNDYRKDIKPQTHSEWRMGDYPMWLYFSLKSNIKFLQEVTGTYRILSESASHSKNYEKQLLFSLGSSEIIKFYQSYVGADTTISSIKVEELKLQLAVIRNDKYWIKRYIETLKKLSRCKIGFIQYLRTQLICFFPRIITTLLKCKRLI